MLWGSECRLEMCWVRWFDSGIVLEAVQVVMFGAACWVEKRLWPRNKLGIFVVSGRKLAVQICWTVQLQAAVFAEAL